MDYIESIIEVIQFIVVPEIQNEIEYLDSEMNFDLSVPSFQELENYNTDMSGNGDHT